MKKKKNKDFIFNYNHLFNFTLVLLFILRTLMLLGFFYGYPHLKDSFGWYFYHGGDERQYFAIAYNFSHFHLIHFKTSAIIGFPLLLTPLVFIFQAEKLTQLLPALVIIQGVILFGTTLFLLAKIARRVTKNIGVSLLTTFIWTIFPYILLYGGRGNWEQVHVDVSYQTWTQMLTEPSSAFFVILGCYLFLTSLENESWHFPALTGITIGIATLIRLQNMIMIGLIFLVFMFYKKPKKATLFILMALFAFTPQLIYNWKVWESPLAFSYTQALQKVASRIEKRPFSICYILPLLRGRVNLYPFLHLFPPLLVLGFVNLWKRAKRETIFLTMWQLSYLFFYGSYYNSVWGISRFLLPALPAILIMTSSSLISMENIHPSKKDDTSFKKEKPLKVLIINIIFILSLLIVFFWMIVISLSKPYPKGKWLDYIRVNPNYKLNVLNIKSKGLLLKWKDPTPTNKIARFNCYKVFRNGKEIGITSNQKFLDKEPKKGVLTYQIGAAVIVILEFSNEVKIKFH